MPNLNQQSKTDQVEIQQDSYTYPIADTGQTTCYDDGTQIPCPNEGEPYYGQDAQYQTNQLQYLNNKDGTISDLVTGLMWTQSSDLNGDDVININDKLTYENALKTAEDYDLAGYTDWRLPSINELYSLINFSGVDPSGWNGTDTSLITPFLHSIFQFGYGDVDTGERIIDAQFATHTRYVSTTMSGEETIFGVNFADGRIKGYPIDPKPGQSEGKLFYILFVRGNSEYGTNDFIDNQDGAISDLATGLTWVQVDSGSSMDWEGALSYCQNLESGGYSDWRLPDVKELQSILDYDLSPDTTASAAINPIFQVTAVTNEAGQVDYPFFWSSTTHTNIQASRNASHAAYVSFGRAMGYMHGEWIDVHGAGAQRSDPKSGDAADYPTGRGPQGDSIRIENYVRCVRSTGLTTFSINGVFDGLIPGLVTIINQVKTRSFDLG